jgi:hypothetical protein
MLWDTAKLTPSSRRCKEILRKRRELWWFREKVE